MHILRKKQFFLLISVACIKQELDDAAFDVRIEPNEDPLLIKVDGVNGSLFSKKQNQITERNGSIEEIYIKEEPPQDDLVS